MESGWLRSSLDHHEKEGTGATVEPREDLALDVPGKRH